jgi:glycosyltransferase involved in cell wall biosynthesis
MRIAYMLTSLGRGGAERQVVALAERMAARGHQVVLIVLGPRQAQEWSTSVEVVRLDMRRSLLGLCSGLRRAHRFLRTFHPDLVHSHTFPANITARTLHLLGSAPAVLSTIHNIYEGKWLRTAMYSLSDGLAIHTTAVSVAVANRYIEIGAVPRNKCSVVTNGIDLDQFSRAACRCNLAKEHSHAAGRFIWLAAGRPVPAKDFNNLLTAFARVRAEAPQTQLWIAGELNEAGRVRVHGEIARGEAHSSAQVRWLGLRDDMAETFAACNAFVLSSAWEGMPLVVGEAMAMEKPVVATDVGGVRELVGDDGVIIPAKNSDALADAMLHIMRMAEDQRRTIGKAARERIRQYFDMNAKADEWQALYSRLLSDRQ